jgi:hypothetical protein
VRVVFRSVLAGALVVGAAAAAAVAAPALPFRASLTAATHAPKANTKWYYAVRVTSRSGAPVKARITVQIKDPLGGLHPVLYANTKRKLVNWPIDGRFRDYVIWPTSSAVGVTLTLRVTVVAAGGKTVLAYPVKPI